MLDSNGVTVNNYGWVSFDWLNATIDRWQLLPGHDPDCYLHHYAAPIGVDTDNPTYFRSYSYFVGAPGLGTVPVAGFHDACMGRRTGRRCPDGQCSSQGMESHPESTGQLAAICHDRRAARLPQILPGYERNDVSTGAWKAWATAT